MYDAEYFQEIADIEYLLYILHKD